MPTLFDSLAHKSHIFSNRVVMSPMTRNRATSEHIPTPIMATYYGQRAGAGLIITEGTSPSPNGDGYPRIPGIYSQEQVDAWKAVPDAVHKEGGKIFMQLMHTGRVSHPMNMVEGSKIVAPSAVRIENEQMYTDQEGMQDFPEPHALISGELKDTIQEYVNAAKNAIAAGFDGVEIHGANGYLVEQFIHPHTNQRYDEYGGSIENRVRFAVEVAKAISAEIGAEKTGIRLSPYGVFNELPLYDEKEIEDTYEQLAKELSALDLLYIHVVDQSSMGAPEVKWSVKEKIRKAFNGIVILSGGYDKNTATEHLEKGYCDMIAFAKAFISNPDLVKRFKKDAPLSDYDTSTFYTPGEKGYTDYPFLEEAKA